MNYDLRVEIKPLSINNMYRAGPKGRIIHTPRGLLYKNALRKALAERLIYSTPAEPSLYRLCITVYFEKIINASFVQGNGKDLIKNVDDDGPIKPIQDALFSVLGIPDNYTISTTVEKKQGTPAIQVQLLQVPKEETRQLLQVTEDVIDRWITLIRQNWSNSFENVVLLPIAG